MSSIGCCLGRGTTLASFHDWGRLCSSKLQFDREVMFGARISALFSEQPVGLGRPSGSNALLSLSILRAYQTYESDTRTTSAEPRAQVEGGLKSLMGSRKAVLILLARSRCDDVSPRSALSLGSSSSEPQAGDIPTIFFTELHHCLGFFCLRFWTLETKGHHLCPFYLYKSMLYAC